MNSKTLSGARSRGLRTILAPVLGHSSIICAAVSDFPLEDSSLLVVKLDTDAEFVPVEVVKPLRDEEETSEVTRAARISAGRDVHTSNTVLGNVAVSL